MKGKAQAASSPQVVGAVQPVDVGVEQNMSVRVECEGSENAELVLFRAKECYVYMIPPRKSAASYRADEWDINKWAWEGNMRVISKGDECSIRLEDNTTGELYAQAPIREGQPLPVEAVIDSSRFFVLRIEDNSSGQTRHAFIGIGFRERTPAYDFQAVLYDHLKYLNKKKHAEELEQKYQSEPSIDYSLKEGETLRLQLKTANIKSHSTVRSKFFYQNLNAAHNEVPVPPSSSNSSTACLAPPPPPPFSPVRHLETSSSNPSDIEDPLKIEHAIDDDFGDFQTAE